jgi:hypothetical protein
METQALITPMISSDNSLNSVSQFRQEYLGYNSLYRLQPQLVQRFLEVQAASIAEAVVQGLSQVRFSLPDRIAITGEDNATKTDLVPVEFREQLLGGLVGRLIHTDLRTALRSRLLELEQAANSAVSTSAILVRHAVVLHMVHNMLPSGKSVHYISRDGEEIPSTPIANAMAATSALTSTSDATTVEEDRRSEGRGELEVPYVEAARRFFLPQWVSFDENGELLVASISESEAHIASMQNYLAVLHAAVGLAPYMVADEAYQSKRYGILGQLVNQGRALAHYQVKEIIMTIQQRAADHDLDRGLSLSLPYFNDQTLKIEEYNFDIIPAGRIMFVPAFVVLAVRAQGAKVAQDTRLSHSTRKHLLAELALLEDMFLR